LGGFVDGIVLHQILQWHHMVSHVQGLEPHTVHALEVNTLADGVFHLIALACVASGSTLGIVQWRQGRRAPSWRFHFGLVLAGWGRSTWLRDWSITSSSASITCATI